MRVSEQIDALEIMGINTRSYLVMPKILGALLVVPCLVVISAVLAIWGGRVAGSMSGIIAPDIFDAGLRQNLNTYNITFALYKAYTFAFIISSIPAYYGYHALMVFVCMLSADEVMSTATQNFGVAQLILSETLPLSL